MKCYGRWLALAFALATAGCSGDSLTVPPTQGILEITTLTGGAEPDADGYTLQVNGGAAEAIGPSATWRSTELDPGSYTVQLAGLSPNCSVAENPRTVTVTGGETATVAFQLTCSATSGSLQVSASSSGASTDADGYTLVVDGADRGALGSSGTLEVTGLTPGDHMVGLSGVAGNCQVEGDNPRAVPVTAGASASTAFAITCAAPPADAGSLRVTTTSSGPDQDGDGYALALDGGTGQPIGTSAAATLPNLAAGAHSVRLSGLAANCSVQGTNPRPVTVTAGATAEVSFAVTCTVTAGSIQVTTTTSGTSIDGDGYTLRVDGGTPQSVAVNGTLTVPGLAAGAHTVVLEGLSSNCTPAGDNPRTVTVTAGSEAPVAFAVTCSAPALRWQRMESSTDFFMKGIWGSASSDVFAVGEGPAGTLWNSSVFHYNGQSWSTQSHHDGLILRDIWGSAANDVFAVGYGGSPAHPAAGDGAILHYDGAGWTAMQPPVVGSESGSARAFYSSVWGSSSSDVFAVGEAHPGSSEILVAHYDGTSWSRMEVPSPHTKLLEDVFGVSANNVWAVGNITGPGLFDEGYGFVFHYNGSAWTYVTGMPVGSGLLGVWASSPADVFAVGGLNGSGAVFHYDGQSWTPMTVPPTGTLRDVWGTSASDVYAVGDGGIVHYDGTSWTRVSEEGGLRGVWGTSSNDVFVVGGGGKILHGTP